ncbi:helix-turn-helix domain-containing protein, partial [Erysipelothrix tonsillarum]
MNILSTFGLNLKEVRLEAKLTQEELAELTNFHRTYIGLLEAGKRNPTLD